MITRTQFAVLSLSLAACADSAPESRPDGLDLEISASDHVAGTFTKDSVSLSFDFWADRKGTTHVSTLETADGEHLMTSVLAGGMETINVLDGRLTISGRSGSVDPAVAGDPAAMAEMTDRLETKLLPELRIALSAQGIDDELHTPDAEKNPDAGVFNPWDGYYHLAPGESRAFATWSFWYPTNVYVRNFRWSCATYDMRATGFSYVGPLWGGVIDHWTGYWWGFPLTISQLNAYVRWDSSVCVPGDIGVVSY